MDPKYLVFILGEIAGEFDDLSCRLVFGGFRYLLVLPQNIGKLILLSTIANCVEVRKVMPLGSDKLNLFPGSFDPAFFRHSPGLGEAVFDIFRKAPDHIDGTLVFFLHKPGCLAKGNGRKHTGLLSGSYILPRSGDEGSNLIIGKCQFRLELAQPVPDHGHDPIDPV